MTGKGQLRIGTSGWQYRHWLEVFYPRRLPQRQWLEFYAGRFDTVEVNNTFYHLPTEATFDSWRRRAPAGFCYALKYSRYGTHLKRLADPGRHIGAFLERARRLGEFLGPILVQLPPRWRVNADRLARFLDAAPADLRWAVEFRDESWLREDVFGILRNHNAALCLHDLIPDHPLGVTADWVYLRYHGAGQRYGGCYSARRLSGDAGRIRAWLEAGRDVFAYFNNDAGGYAPRNAAELRRFCLAGGTRPEMLAKARRSG
jgi:uncharacterized protein YecE (DUF72 family)